MGLLLNIYRVPSVKYTYKTNLLTSLEVLLNSKSSLIQLNCV